MKIATICLTIFLFTIIPINNIIARNNVSKIPPRWLEYQDTNYNNNAYSIIIGEGGGDKLSAAKQSSFANMTTKLETERGILVSSTINATSVMTQTINKNNYDIKEEFLIKYEEKDKLINVKCKVIDEYWFIQNGQYTCYSLYAVANGVYGSTLVDDIRVTVSYGANGLWRSAIIPGWGQLYKGSTTKGYCIMGATAVGVAGIIVCENLRSSYIRKISEQPKNALYYSQQADNWENGRNIAIGATAAIYIYNIIDAIAAKGAKRVVVKKRKVSYSAAPTVMSDGSAGLFASITF